MKLIEIDKIQLVATTRTLVNYQSLFGRSLHTDAVEHFQQQKQVAEKLKQLNLVDEQAFEGLSIQEQADLLQDIKACKTDLTFLINFVVACIATAKKTSINVDDVVDSIPAYWFCDNDVLIKVYTLLGDLFPKSSSNVAGNSHKP